MELLSLLCCPSYGGSVCVIRSKGVRRQSCIAFSPVISFPDLLSLRLSVVRLALDGQPLEGALAAAARLCRERLRGQKKMSIAESIVL